MPFKRTNTEPPTNSKVTVTFAGLMLLSPAADDSCEIGIHRFNTTHLFQVILIVNKPNRPLRLIRLLSGPLTDTFRMIVDPTPDTRFQAFATDDGELDRSNATNNALDYRWSFNLRSLHPDAKITKGAEPVVTLNAGVLYTPNLTREDLELKLLQEHDLTKTDIPRVGADLAAAIELPSPSTMKLNWNELGDPQEVILPRDGDPVGTTYTIAILNDPPISSEPAHDELDLYYKVLREGDDKVKKPFRLSGKRTGKTDEIPCLPVIFE